MQQKVAQQRVARIEYDPEIDSNFVNILYTSHIQQGDMIIASHTKPEDIVSILQQFVNDLYGADYEFFDLPEQSVKAFADLSTLQEWYELTKILEPVVEYFDLPIQDGWFQLADKKLIQTCKKRDRLYKHMNNNYGYKPLINEEFDFDV